MRRGEKFELAQAYDLLKAHYIQGAPVDQRTTHAESG